MDTDALHYATVKVLHTVASHVTVAALLAGLIASILGGGTPTIATQMVSAVFMVSLFVALGTALRLWALHRRSRRNDHHSIPASRNA